MKLLDWISNLFKPKDSKPPEIHNKIEVNPNITVSGNSMQNPNLQNSKGGNKKSKRNHADSSIFEFWDLSGSYEYSCILFGSEPFPDGSHGNAHGGNMQIKAVLKKRGIQLSIRGERTWSAQGNANQGIIIAGTEREISKPIDWHARDAAIIPDETMFYRYEVPGIPVHGISIADFNPKDSSFKGKFKYYFSPKVTKLVDNDGNEINNYQNFIEKLTSKEWIEREGIIKIKKTRN